MYRVRFHGRGGQGIKTASRILGSALFAEGYEVQDAPRYGAERRGAPIFAYVRADHAPINERGVIHHPDLVVVTDDSLFAVPSAGVMLGVERRTALLLNSRENAGTWRHRLGLEGPIHCLSLDDGDADGAAVIGLACVGAAARLLGTVSWASLSSAIEDELASLDSEELKANRDAARYGFDRMAEFAESVRPDGEGEAVGTARAWVDVPFELADVSAPTIHGAATSEEANTGLWRTTRPVIQSERCHRCWWICSTFCPDGAIEVSEDGRPSVDYDHCKGCLVCVAVCPHHAIDAVPEHAAGDEAVEGVE